MKLTKENEKRAIKMYKSGISSIEISKKLGYSKRTILLLLKKNKIEIRKKVKKNKLLVKPRLNDLVVREAMEMYKNGINLADAARSLGINECSLAYQLKKHGIWKFKGVRKYFCNFDFFEKIDTEGKAYWLGFICADGNISRDCLHIGIHKDDAPLLNLFVEEINGNYPVKIKKYISRGKESWIARVDIYSKKIKNDLKKYGVVPNKTGKLDWGLATKHIPYNLLNHFVRGFIDGDGCFKKNGSLSILEKGNSFLKGILFFLKERGVNTSSSVLPIKRDTHIGCYKLEIGGKNNINKIYEILYKDASLFLERKRERSGTNFTRSQTA